MAKQVKPVRNSSKGMTMGFIGLRLNDRKAGSAAPCAMPYALCVDVRLTSRTTDRPNNRTPL